MNEKKEFFPDGIGQKQDFFGTFNSTQMLIDDLLEAGELQKDADAAKMKK